MKNIIFCAFIIATVLSCNKNEEAVSDLVGTYLLIEVLLDPGDGSGTFESVTSNKTVTLLIDETITSNGDLCAMSQETSGATAGTYSEADGTISSPNCSDLNFELNGNELIIDYPCIEPCRAKFLRQ